MADSLKPLADAILAEQLALKSSGHRRLPRYATPLLSISLEKLALITLGTLLNTISQSEFEDGVAPALTSAAYEIGQRCRRERIRSLKSSAKRSHEIPADVVSKPAKTAIFNGTLPPLQGVKSSRVPSLTSANSELRVKVVPRPPVAG